VTELRVGVVGINGIGQAHLWALHAVEQSTLAAVCDIDEPRQVQASLDHRIQGFNDASELYASGAVDAVVIATPADTHAELVRGALEAGLHVYCEKPVTPVADDAFALAALADARGLVFQVGFQFRFHKGYAALRDAVAQLGPVRRVHVTATNWFRAQRYFDASPWRATWQMAGGGVLMNQAVHQVDALIATVGMPNRVQAEVRNVMHRAEVEDDAVAQLEWANGARGTLVASLCEPAGGERFEIQCARGAVTLDDGYDVRVAHHEDAQQLVDECPDEFPADAVTWTHIEVPRAKSEWFDMMLDAHREFGAAVAEGRQPLVDGREGARSVALANAIYTSSVSGRAADVPLDEGVYRPVFEDLASRRSILPS
jgi:predicted dehydrogenase